MKVTIDVPERELRDILKYSGEKLKGAAVLRLALNELNYRKRVAMNNKFHSGEWSLDLPTLEELRRERSVWQ